MWRFPFGWVNQVLPGSEIEIKGHYTGFWDVDE
jgi:hypothetical protein